MRRSRTMEDPKDLRDQAARWRRLARYHDTRVARALTAGAYMLEQKADRIERDPTASTTPSMRPDRSGRRTH